MSGISEQQAAEYLAQQQYDRAIAVYEQCIQAAPTTMSNYWHLGLALLLQGQRSEAHRLWRSSIEGGNPAQLNAWTAELIEVLNAQALRCEAVSDVDNARLIRQSIREFVPEHLNNFLALVGLDLQINPLASSVKRELLQLAQMLWDKQPTDLDLKLLLKVLEKVSYIDPFHDLFEICLNQGLMTEDRTLFKKLNNRLGSAHNEMAHFLFNKRGFDLAYQHFKIAEILKTDIIDPQELATYHYNIGITLAEQGKYEEAISCFIQTRDKSPAIREQAEEKMMQAKYHLESQRKGYKFTRDWFSENISTWKKYLQEFIDRPGLHILEIGSWEGRSTCWMLENILTHPSAKITCIDTFKGSEEHKNYQENYLESLEDRFDRNIAITGAASKVQKRVGYSQEVMRSLPLNAYDMLYIDGSHLACDVLADAVLGWGLLKVGGLCIFDDYNFLFSENPGQNPQIAIDAFVSSFRPKLKLLHKGNQVILQKIAN